MNRRALLATAAGTLAAAVAGCQDGASTGDCSVPAETDLATLLPPAPDGYERSSPQRGSEPAREEAETTAVVAAEYRDDDDEVLDDLTVRLLRFREDAAARQVLAELLTNVEFDSGRVGTAALLDRVGVVAVAPTRERARSLLVRSPALSARCYERNRVTPVRTRTQGGEGTARPTETGN